MALPKPHPGLVIAYDYLWHEPGAAAAAAAGPTAQRSDSTTPAQRSDSTTPAQRHDSTTPAQQPAALVLAVADEAGERLVTAAPIAAYPPGDPRDAIELPHATCRRLGLDFGNEGSDARHFVIVSEVNRFVWPGPDLRPVATRSASAFVYGVLPPRLFKRITAQLIGRWHARGSE
ncbi:MAG: hypothetical protein WEC00_09815 [Dongiaceae bacterium]